MADEPFVKTVLEVTVLSEGYVGKEGYDLAVIANEIIYGSCSGKIEEKEVKTLTKRELIKECEDQGTDPAFFLGDKEDY